MDETGSKRGHRYGTAVTDADSRRLLFLAEGKGKGSEQTERICMDMSLSYISGAKEQFPRAQIVFDRSHFMQMAGEVVDQIRKECVRQGLLPKGSLWALRGNEWTRSGEQKIKDHWDGVLAVLQSRVINGLIEAINGLIQLTNKMASGLRSFRYLRIAAFLKAGKLTLDVPALAT